MEVRMYELATEMKTALEGAINRRQLLLALEAAQFALSLFGAGFSFMGAKADNKKFGKFGAIISGTEKVSIG